MKRGAETPVVLVVRHPDADTMVELYGLEATVMNVDLGRSALDDYAEFVDWAEATLANACTLPKGHRARAAMAMLVIDQADFHGHSWLKVCAELARRPGWSLL